MLSFHRIHSEAEDMFAQAWALYTVSFPSHEQRPADRQVNLLTNPQYHFDVILDGGAFVGIILYWTLSGYVYIEHFAIRQDMRGRDLGTRSLAAFCREHGLVILEIDPPVDEASVRREAFYHRLGFVSSLCGHTHPAYRAEFAPHALVVMSYPRPLDAGEVRRFQRELCDIVMADAGNDAPCADKPGSDILG